MGKNKITVKQDINFLEYPMWSIERSRHKNKLVIEKDNGKYVIEAPKYGIGNVNDAHVLYNILAMSQSGEKYNKKIITTRYQLANRAFNKKSSGTVDYRTLINSLYRWQDMRIHFDGIFYNGDSHTSRSFGIINGHKINHETRELTIYIDEQFLEYVQNTNFSIYLSLSDLSKFKRPVSSRLFEILSKSFFSSSVFWISINNLGEKLTLTKRASAKNYYLSDILTKIKPAIKEINQSTELQIDYTVDKNNGAIKFVKSRQSSTLVDKLLNFGIKQPSNIIEKYPANKIKEKIKLAKQSNGAIHNPSGWLISALDEDWNYGEINKRKEAYKPGKKPKVERENVLRDPQKEKEEQEMAVGQFNDVYEKDPEFARSFDDYKKSKAKNNIYPDKFVSEEEWKVAFLKQWIADRDNPKPDNQEPKPTQPKHSYLGVKDAVLKREFEDHNYKLAIGSYYTDSELNQREVHKKFEEYMEQQPTKGLKDEDLKRNRDAHWAKFLQYRYLDEDSRDFEAWKKKYNK